MGIFSRLFKSRDKPRNSYDSPSYSYFFGRFNSGKRVKETLNKARLTALYAICLQIFRHIAQKSLAIRQYVCGTSMQFAEKSDYASYAQALFGVSLMAGNVSSVIDNFTFCIVDGEVGGYEKHSFKNWKSAVPR